MIERLLNEKYRPWFPVVIYVLITVLIGWIGWVGKIGDFGIPEFFQQLLRTISQEGIAVFFIGLLIKFLVPEISIKSQLDIVHPQDINPILKEMARKTKKWIFKGACGRYTRSATLKIISEAIMEDNRPRTVSLFLLNPKNVHACTCYAEYKNSLSKTQEWNCKKVQEEILATIITGMIYKCKHSSLLTLDIYLLDTFSVFRVDISDECVIITKEDKDASGLKAVHDSHFYDYYSDDTHYLKEQIKSYSLKIDISDIQKITGDLVREIKEADKLLKSIDTVDCNVIAGLVKEPQNPYK